MSDQARVLIWDLENTPLIGYTWGTYETDVIQISQQSHLLSFAWKWLGEKSVHVLGLNDFPQYRKDLTNDYYLVKELHSLIDQADVTIAHNGDRFDMRKARARFLVHNLLPPSPVKQIDTLKVARKYFSMASNKLDDLGNVLGVGRKIDVGGFKVWLGCMAGDEKSWARMKKYNKQDVQLLEDVYLRLRPWIDGHPNIAILNGDMDSCPRCGADAMTKQGMKRNRTTLVQQWKCTSCGGWASSRCSEKAPQPSLVN